MGEELYMGEERVSTGASGDFSVSYIHHHLSFYLIEFVNSGFLLFGLRNFK